MVACNKLKLLKECTPNTSTISKTYAIRENTYPLPITNESIYSIVRSCGRHIRGSSFYMVIFL